MKIEITGIENGAPIPDRFCSMAPDRFLVTKPGPNVSPEVRWTELPEGTKSLAIILEDRDAPADGTNVNRPGTVLPEDMERTSFHHWVLVDIPPAIGSVAEGVEGNGFERGGKPLTRQSYGLRGANDFAVWFASNPEMAGAYGGYFGPAPPSNDERVHTYHYRVFALDIDTLGLSGNFNAAAVMQAMKGHIVGEAEVAGTCTLNPRLRA